MQKDSLDFLMQLLATPSPSGFEPAIQKVVKRRMAGIADEIRVDVHGNLIASLNPGGSVRVMLAGHCDQIGLMVTHIDDSGFIYFGEIGGLDPSVVPGTSITIHARGGPIEGIIGRKAIHLMTDAERNKKVHLKDLWIDIGARDGKEAKGLVEIGDPATFRLGAQRLGKHRLTSVGCDDRVGLFVVMEAMRLVAAAPARKKGGSPVALYAVSTVQEELGLRGARTSSFGIDPHVGIAVDVTHASDNPGANPKEIGTITLGEGPTIARGPNINPVLEDLLVKTAKAKRLPYQTIGVPRATANDANALQINRAGVAASIIGIPNRYMHTPVELVDLRDVQAAAKLIAETVLRITARTSFIPR